MKADPLRQLRKEILEVQDRHPHLSPDNAFVVWFLRAFVVDDEATALNSIVGGARDKGIDALHIDHENRLVVVVQGKYRQKAQAKSENRADVLALANLGRVLVSNSKQEFSALLKDADPAVEGLLGKARKVIQTQGYRLILNFATTGKVSGTHRDEAVQCLDYWDTTSFEVHDRADLARRMHDYSEGAAPPVPAISLPIHGEQSFSRFDKDVGISSWVFTILGTDLAKIFRDNGIRVFQRNIRGYLGKSDINRGIETTLAEEPQYFWYFNNGVTIVCDDARQITDRNRKFLRVFNAQIINGQQTTRSLASATAKGATVLAKVIAVSRDNDDDQFKYSHLVNEIVSATNSQNAIGQIDLKSNDLEQVRLERDLKKLGYRYIRKRQSKGEIRRADPKRYKALITKEELARAAGACILDPFEVRLGVNRLFSDEPYNRIFDGSPAIDYLTFYRLFRIASQVGRGDSRLGYAKWLTIHFIWSQVGKELRRTFLQNKFLHVAERESQSDNSKTLQQLRIGYRHVYSATLAFYRANKRTTTGGVLDLLSFFKYPERHIQFEKYWLSRSNGRRRVAEVHLRKFIDALKEMDG